MRSAISQNARPRDWPSALRRVSTRLYGLPFAQHVLSATVLALCVAAFTSTLHRGWMPHDEGYFSQAAERVLTGELPHRDFAEMYTGGLTYLHALAFDLFGVRFASLRLVLLAFALTSVLTLFVIARRIASPVVASLLTLLSVVWSFPNYFASVPSWYNLTFTLLAVAALFRHARTGETRWVTLAGVIAGLSFLIKVTALYLVAAALLYLV
jgi:4-amino-4-deoxy-L-arabinose transferase-like glycosyltransferase